MATLEHPWGTVLDTLTVLVGTLLVGNEVAIAAFVHPALGRIDDLSHRRAAREIAAALGRWAPPWYAASALLLAAAAWFRRDATLGTDAGAWLLAIVVTVVLIAPLNARIAKWDPERPPEDWRTMRRRWDAMHIARTAWLAAAQVVAVTILVR